MAQIPNTFLQRLNLISRAAVLIVGLLFVASAARAQPRAGSTAAHIPAMHARSTGHISGTRIAVPAAPASGGHLATVIRVAPNGAVTSNFVTTDAANFNASNGVP